MRKRLLVLGGVVLVVVVVLVLTRGGVVGKKTTACQSFIATIQKGDAQKSYNMFSAAAQKSLKLSDWQKQVPDYRLAYGRDTVPKLVSDANKTSLNSSSDSLVEVYDINYQGMNFEATCYLQKSGTSYTVDGFVSKVKY